MFGEEEVGGFTRAEEMGMRPAEAAVGSAHVSTASTVSASSGTIAQCRACRAAPASQLPVRP